MPKLSSVGSDQWFQAYTPINSKENDYSSDIIDWRYTITKGEHYQTHTQTHTPLSGALGKEETAKSHEGKEVL